MLNCVFSLLPAPDRLALRSLVQLAQRDLLQRAHQQRRRVRRLRVRFSVVAGRALHPITARRRHHGSQVPAVVRVGVLFVYM